MTEIGRVSNGYKVWEEFSLYAVLPSRERGKLFHLFRNLHIYMNNLGYIFNHTKMKKRQSGIFPGITEKFPSNYCENWF